MKIEAKTNILYNGVYRMPGTPFECDDKEAKRLVKMGAATDKIDPAMAKIAAKKIEKLEKEAAELGKQLEKAQARNAENKKKIDELTSAINEAQTPEEKEKLQKKAEAIKGNMLDEKTIYDQLQDKEAEREKLAG